MGGTCIISIIHDSFLLEICLRESGFFPFPLTTGTVVEAPNFHLFVGWVGADESVAASSILLDSGSSGLRRPEGRVRYFNPAGTGSFETSRPTEKGVSVGSSVGGVIPDQCLPKMKFSFVVRRSCTGTYEDLVWLRWLKTSRWWDYESETVRFDVMLIKTWLGILWAAGYSVLVQDGSWPSRSLQMYTFRPSQCCW